jgi:signal transduction histidine kinase
MTDTDLMSLSAPSALSVQPGPVQPGSGWRWGRSLSLAGQYNVTSLVVLLLSMLFTGWWVGHQIRVGVIHRTAATSALYIQGFLANQLGDLGSSDWLSKTQTEAIEKTLANTPLGKEIVSVKIWAPGGKVVFGENAGQVFPVKDDQALAWSGEVSSDISNLSDSENATQRPHFSQLIETYTPVRLKGSERVIAVAEFYQTVGPLNQEILSSQLRSWAAVALATLLTYLALSGLVRRGSDTIARQQVRLREQVGTLETVLAQMNTVQHQNQELHGRVSRAAARTAAHSERFLLRVSSDLHDGPAQDLSFALLRLESLSAYTGLHPEADRTLKAVEHSLSSAMREMRAIATDLRLPDLEPLDLQGTLERAVRDHRRRSNRTAEPAAAELTLGELPQQVPLALKITAFRIVQEALNNAERHAGGQNSQAAAEVSASVGHGMLTLRVCDRGPGFVWNGQAQDGHLGLVGMRERAESLGGTFTVRPWQDGGATAGTCVEARLPLNAQGGEYV